MADILGVVGMITKREVDAVEKVVVLVLVTPL